MERHSPPRVLYVEDEPVVRRMVTRAIERDGFEIRTAADGSQGVALAHEWHPDVILMDLMMPVMDGFQAARALRSDLETRDIPIVAYSASPPDPAMRHALEAGIDAFLPKTTPHREIVSAIRARLCA